MSGPYDRVGEGNYLREAEKVFDRVLKAHGWSAVKTREVRDRLWRVGLFNVREADIFTLTGPGEKMYVHVPLAAKEYVLHLKEEGGKDWYSVSEKVLNEARAYDTDVVLTYIHELGAIRVSDARTALLDTKKGPYLRFYARYYGWYLSTETVPLGDWLDNPETALKGQTRIAES